MPLKHYKPTSPGRRLATVSDFAEVSTKAPEKSLTESIKKSGGRNNHGHITTRHVGGGHKRRYRIIDWKREKEGVPARVAAIEYDPNRSARLALLHSGPRLPPAPAPWHPVRRMRTRGERPAPCRCRQ